MVSSKKVALVTGGNKGIGYAICRQLAEAGVAVLLGARDAVAGEAAAAALREEGLDVRSVAVDVANDASIAAAAERIAADPGRLDILVNNAGISGDHRTVPSEASLDVMRGIYATNVFGLTAMIQALLPLLRRSPAGRIVNMSTGLASLSLTAGPEGPFAFSRLLAYNSSKTAVNAITVQFANELADTSIRINAANPGLCATDLSSGKGRPPAEGAAVAVRLALWDEGSPNGILFGDSGKMPW